MRSERAGGTHSRDRQRCGASSHRSDAGVGIPASWSRLRLHRRRESGRRWNGWARIWLESENELGYNFINCAASVCAAGYSRAVQVALRIARQGRAVRIGAISWSPLKDVEQGFYTPLFKFDHGTIALEPSEAATASRAIDVPQFVSNHDGGGSHSVPAVEGKQHRLNALLG